MAVSRYTLQPDKVETGKEYWTMSCETTDGKMLESKEIYVERGQAVTADFGCGAAGAASVPGEQGAGTNPPRKKATSKRAACMKKAAKIKSKTKRKAAVRRCKKRYPTAAEKRAAAKRRAAAKSKAA